MTPYRTRTGVQIGLLYQKPLPHLSYDEELIQGVLLRDRSMVWHRAIKEWFCYILTIFVVVLAFWGAK